MCVGKRSGLCATSPASAAAGLASYCTHTIILIISTMCLKLIVSVYGMVGWIVEDRDLARAGSTF